MSGGRNAGRNENVTLQTV